MSDTSDSQQDVIRVLNPGQNREVAINWFRYGHPFHKDAGQAALEQLDSMRDPWLDLAFWESTYQVKEGIASLCRQPFFRANQGGDPEKWVPTRLLYPNALTTKNKTEVSNAVEQITASVRQGREYYLAAQSVSEEARPTLYYYSAMMLARATVMAFLGVNELEKNRSHGLSVRSPSDTDSWPQLVGWDTRGNFVALYRTVRWDTLFGVEPPKKTDLPQFHIMECLRRLNKMTWGDEVSWADSTHSTSSLSTLMKAWDPLEQTPYLRPEEVSMRRIYDIPDILVELMVLYYFSIVARYHPVTWQKLLAGDYKEGYFLRKTASYIYFEFVRHILELLPTPRKEDFLKQVEWVNDVPDPATLQRPSTIPDDSTIRT